MIIKPVFFDPTGRRSRLVRALAWVVGAFSALVVVAFAAILVIVHRPVNDSLLSAHGSIRCAWAPNCSTTHAVNVTAGADPVLLKAANKLAAELRDKERDLRARSPQAGIAERRPVPAALESPKGRPLSIGFYANWDDNSYPALKRALPHLDWIVPSWLSLEGPDMALTPDFDARVLSYIQTTKPDIPILPLIQNAVEGKWNGEGLAKFLADPTARAERIKEIVAFLQSNRFQGLTVDFEEVPAAAQADLRSFMRNGGGLRPLGFKLALAVPYDDDNWDYRPMRA